MPVGHTPTTPVDELPPIRYWAITTDPASAEPSAAFCVDVLRHRVPAVDHEGNADDERQQPSNEDHEHLAPRAVGRSYEHLDAPQQCGWSDGSIRTDTLDGHRRRRGNRHLTDHLADDRVSG